VRVAEYRRTDGRCPFREWLETLDGVTASRIEARLQRFEEGNLGDHKLVAPGIWEARLVFGPGYRLYYGRDGATLIILLVGGDKGSQRRDIIRARWAWAGYLAEKHDGSTT
jgi:putative addiction module killer protein